MKEEDVMQLVECRIPTQGDENLLYRQCGRACRKVSAAVCEGASPPDILLCEAASALTVVYYLQYLILGEENSLKSFKAGDVSVTEDKKDFTALLSRAEEDYRSCLSRLSPYLKEESTVGESEPFFFKGVGGCRFH